MSDLKAKVREVQDFPTPGVGFKDVTPLLADPQLLRETVGDLAEWVRTKNADIVLGAEARGFWIGSAIAGACWFCARCPKAARFASAR